MKGKNLLKNLLNQFHWRSLINKAAEVLNPVTKFMAVFTTIGTVRGMIVDKGSVVLIIEKCRLKFRDVSSKIGDMICGLGLGYMYISV